MSSDFSPESSSASMLLVRRIDEVCDQFEAALQARERPRIEDQLTELPEADRAPLLRELLLLEWEYASRQGCRLSLDEYLARFPAYSVVILEAGQAYAAAAEECRSTSDVATVFASSTVTPNVEVPPPPSDWSPRGYAIVGVLGGGAMGTVYLARQETADRHVALKVMREHLSYNAVGLARFRQEALTLARLQHPNIVQVFEVGEHLGRPYYSMEYCPGGSLADYLRGGPLPPADAAVLLETLARAVHAAHQAEIVHRDLKPANVLLPLDRRRLPVGQVKNAGNSSADKGPLTNPKLADFGLAKRLGADAQTQTGAVLGTPQYMAPEQARGESKGVGPAADVYSLGAILYHCLTGRPPFRGDSTTETVLQVVTQEPVPPRRLRPRLPRNLETICLKCLHKEPRRRYADAAALADDLARFRRGEPIWAQRISAWERTRNWIKRYPAAAAIIALLLVGGLALALVAWSLGKQGDALVEAGKAGELRREAEHRLARLNYEKAMDHVQKDGAAAGLLWLARSLAYANRVGDRDVEEKCRRQIAAWARDVSPLREVFVGHDGYLFAVAYSPNGELIATGSGDRTARLWDVATGRQIGAPLPHEHTVYGVAFSPDGRWLLTGCGDFTAQLWDVATGERIGPPLWHRERVLAVAISPDGKLLLTGSHDGTAQLWDAATFEPLAAFEHPHIVRAVAFSRDGTMIVTGCDDRCARLWDAASGGMVGQPLEHRDQVFAVAMSPDGKKVVTGSSDCTAQIWDVATCQKQGPPLVHRGWVMAAAFSPDGRVILTGSGDHLARLWDAATGVLLGFPFHHVEQVRAAAFSPDGRSVVTTCWDYLTRRWDVSATLMARADLELTLPRRARSLDVSPDGKRLLIGSDDQKVHVCDAATGKLLMPPLVHRNSLWNVLFSPDGKTILGASSQHGVRLWDAATGKLLYPTLQPETGTRVAAFSPDGKSFVLTNETIVQHWETATGRPLGPPQEFKYVVGGLAFRRDGTLLLATSHKHAGVLWEAETGKLIGSPRQHAGWIVKFAFSSDMTRVLTMSYDCTAQVWDVETGRPVTPPLQHRGNLFCGCFSHDGKFVVTGSEDKTVRLWEADTGRLIGPPLQHPDRIEAVACSRDGTTILTACDDKVVRFWKLLPLVEGKPEEITRGVEALTGLELGEAGLVIALDAAAWRERTERLARLDGSRR